MRVLKVALVLSLSLPLLAQSPDPSAPESLRKAVAARSAIVTGKFEWSQRSAARPPMGQKEAPVFFFSSQVTAAENLKINHGDKNGVLLYEQDGTPARIDGTRPTASLIDAEHCWSHANEQLIAKAFTAGSRTGFGLVQLKTLGFTPYAPTIELNRAAFGEPEKSSIPLEYSEERDGDLYVVTEKGPRGQVRFWIDPGKGWSVVRTGMFDVKGTTLCECRTKVREMDGIWFPEEAVFFAASFKEGKEPCDVIRVERAEFNRPEHPRKLTPEDIGIEPGISIEEFDPRDADKRRHVFWDGKSLLSSEEFSAKQRSGEIQISHTVERRIKENREAQQKPRVVSSEEDQALDVPRHSDGTPMLPDFSRSGAVSSYFKFVANTQWEAYTRRFIRLNHLDVDQVQKAWAVCADCQSHAQAYFQKAEKKLTAAQAELQKVEPGPPGREKRQSLTTEIETLLKPINDIFENELKPHLDRLLTRAQHIATQPTPGP